MSISKETELIIKLKQLPGLGPIRIELVAKAMIDFNLFSDREIFSYVQHCIKTHYIKLNEDLTPELFQRAIDNSKRIMDKSLDNCVHIISKYDNLFPVELKQLKSYSNGKFKDVAPLLLTYKGDINSINNKKSVAIIGTRHPTIEGEEAGRYYGEYFAKKGFNIVSGLALGCDIIAHKAALSVTNGTTTAILAHGLHTISPKAHENIAMEIIERGGVLLSEYFYGSPAFKANFVERDRLQAGLSIATIVIQTGIEGGTMHAARTAIDNNKILAAVSYKDELVNEMPNVSGNSYLINKGAFQLRKANMLYDFVQSGKYLQYKFGSESELQF